MMVGERSGWRLNLNDMSSEDMGLFLNAITVVRDETTYQIIKQTIRDSKFVESCIQQPKSEITSLIEEISTELRELDESDSAYEDKQKRKQFLEEALRKSS